MSTPFSKQIDPIILDMAARPNGVSVSEVPHNLPNNDYVGWRMTKMVKKGLLFAEKFGQYNRYFANAKDAAAAKERAQTLARAKLQASEPRGSIRFAKDAEVVFTKDTVFTQGPNFSPRYTAITVPHSGLTRGRVISN